MAISPSTGFRRCRAYISLLLGELGQSFVRSGMVMSDRRTSKPRAEPAKSDRRAPLPSNPQARMVARTALTIALVALALWVAADFLPAVGWAAIIAITAWPLYVRCMPYLGETRSPILAPLIFTMLIAGIVFVPLALAAHQIARQGDATFAWITQSRESGIAVPPWVAQLPIAAEMVRHGGNRTLPIQRLQRVGSKASTPRKRSNGRVRLAVNSFTAASCSFCA